jgi:hypothetical protein
MKAPTQCRLSVEAAREAGLEVVEVWRGAKHYRATVECAGKQATITLMTGRGDDYRSLRNYEGQMRRLAAQMRG